MPVFPLMELVMGIGPMNLVITNDALYRLSYTSARNEHYSEAEGSLQVLFRFWRVNPPRGSGSRFRPRSPANESPRALLERRIHAQDALKT